MTSERWRLPDQVPRHVEILNAAAALFCQRGFAAVGVDEIGAAVGLSGPAIYRHFSGKAEILSTLFDQGMDEVFRVTTHTHEDPTEALASIARAHASHVLRNPLLASMWLHEARSLTGAHRRRHRQRTDRYLTRWTDALQRCYPEAPESATRAVALAALGALNAVDGWPPDVRSDANVEVLVAMVLRGAEILRHAE